MDKFPKRPTLLSKVVAKPKPLAAHPKPLAVPQALQGVKDRVQAVLGKNRNGQAGANPLLNEYLEALTSGTAEAEQMIADLKARGQEEVERRRHLLRPLTEILKPLNNPQARMKFQREILRPAQQRQLSSQDVWDRVDWLFQDSAKFGPRRVNRLIKEAEDLFGTLTFTLGVGAEGGAGAGVEGAVGIAGLRHHCVAFVRSSTVAIGPYADLSLCVQAAVSAGTPEAAVGFAIDVSFSAAYGVAGEVTISLLPSLHRPTLAPEKGRDWSADKVFGGDVHRGIFADYSFAGLGVSLGVGAPAAGCSCGITVSESWLLGGVAK